MYLSTNSKQYGKILFNWKKIYPQIKHLHINFKILSHILYSTIFSSLKMCKISTAIHSFLCAVLHYWILCGLNKIRRATCNKSKIGTLKLKNVKQNMEMKFKNIISRQCKFGQFLHLFWRGRGSTDPPKQGAILEGFYDKYYHIEVPVLELWILVLSISGSVCSLSCGRIDFFTLQGNYFSLEYCIITLTAQKT